VLGREAVEGEQVLFGVLEQLADLRRHGPEPLEHDSDSFLGLLVALGVEDLSERGGDQAALVAAAVHDHVASEMHRTALPRAPQHAGDRGLQSLVLIADR
jgi:hypothetical protein